MGASDRSWRFFVGIGSIHFIQHVFRILPPVLPILALDFQVPLWQLGGLVSIYFLGSGLGQAPAGILADHYDRQLLLPPSIGVMGLGYLVVATAPWLGDSSTTVVLFSTSFTLPYLLIALGVFVAGLGASTIHPAGYPLVAANVRAGQTGRAFGAWGSGAKLGDAAAPLSVAVLVLWLRWDHIFLLFGLVGLVYAALLFSMMAGAGMDSRPGARRVGTDHEQRRPGQEGEAAADPRRYAYPMVALFVFFVARAFSEKGLKAFLPTFLVIVYAYSFSFGSIHLPPESFANLYFTAVFLVAAGVQLLTGELVDRYDHRLVLVTFLLGATGAVLALATGTLSPVILLIVLIVLGVTNWGWTPARDALVNEITPAAREGRTFGYLHTVSHLASAIAPLAIGYLADQGGLLRSFVVLGFVVLIAVASIGVLFSRRVYLRGDPRPSGTS